MNPCHIILIGAAAGRFLEKFKQRNWDVTGYDYCENAVESMNQKNITGKLIDLNSVDTDEILIVRKIS